VTPAGQVTEFPLSVPPPPSHNYHRTGTIVAGSDGNLWFGERDAIGRSTTAGEVTSFALPAGASAPTSMTVGPDMDVWFTEGAASRIGRITQSGEISEFQLSSGRQPSGIATGPDGDLWFTERGANRIGQMTPTGKVREFVVPGPPAKLASIAVGPDGNLWFAEAAAPRVGRIKPNGLVTQFRVPTVKGTEAIVSGPGGRLYFNSGPEVGAITTAGKISWPSCLVGSCNRETQGLALGPDGQLWAASGPAHCPSICGGGTGLYYGALPGSVAPFKLPPPRLEIGPRLAPLRGRRTTLTVACELDAGCRGTLKLGSYVTHDRRSMFRTWCKAPIDLRQGESRRITLTFSRRAAAGLHRHRRTHLLALATGPDGTHARRGLELSA
jgi:virginiamycin B lyase